MPVADPRRGDVIALTGVRVRGHHGVLDVERREGQEFVVDVEMGLDLERAAGSDDIRHTVNYAEVGATVVEVVQAEAQDLIETVAALVADRVLSTQPLVESVAVTVHKPQAPVGVPFGDVAVTLRRRRDAPVVIALGANLGDPVASVRGAARRLHRVRGLRAVRLSPLYRSDPVGGPPQPDYVNAVALARTSRSAASLLAALHSIENDLGRVRAESWGARTLDLDLIQYGDPALDADLRSDEQHLRLPHPRAAERAFVLVPWHTLDHAAMLRVGDQVRPVAGLLAGMDTRGVAALDPAP